MTETVAVVLTISASLGLLLLLFLWAACWSVTPCPNCRRRFWNFEASDEWYGWMYHCRSCGYGNCCHSDHALYARVNGRRNGLTVLDAEPKSKP